uniref:EOG090X04G3 n=1 Tax=Lynceus sp. MCZ IZ 141354 TaxID=1930659 RepID=A0A9N6WR26_9CRUS|nr:EOG090X04G3 [Lynceus sp. MCZ IZ 141354]
MGSKKHKKHKSERWEKYQGSFTDRPQLRLILKVGGSTPEHSDSSASQTRLPVEEESQHSFMGERLEKHKKKKKEKKKKREKDKEKKKHKKDKEKKRREREESGNETDNPQDKSDQQHQYEVISNPTRPILKITTAEGREKRTCVLRQRQERPALQKLLDTVLSALERKDPRQFFAWPVTDSIAPGYSQIITKPMDFSSIRAKIDNNEYKSLMEMGDDFTLMCNNAMTYNQPDTVYYKAAKRLLHSGVKILSTGKIRRLVPTICNFGELTTEQLGFEPLEESFAMVGQDDDKQEVSSDADMETARDKFLTDGPDHFEGLPDEMTADEILEQVQEASEKAAERLEHKYPNAHVGFLRKKKDGTTSLAILTPHSGCEPGSMERPVTLGELLGKVQGGSGSTQLQGFREDRRNLVKGCKPIYYNAFTSFAPSYDSTFANLTKEDADLVNATYGDDVAVQYAESVLNFVKDCDYALHIADELLNLMTHGEHASVAKMLDEKRKQEQQVKVQQLEQEATINFDSLRSLGDIGIDVSFLDSMETQYVAQYSSQSRLDETGVLISTLEKVQRERLSQMPPANLSNMPGPSEMEVKLVERITDGLTQMAKQVHPSDVASTTALRKAMGISSGHEAEQKNDSIETLPKMEVQSNDNLDELRVFLSSSDKTDAVMAEIFN